MLTNIIKKIKEEKGLSEAATAIIVLPIILGALFVMLDVGFYMRTRSLLDTVVQDTVRGVALDGGVNNPRTNSLGPGVSWQTKGQASLNRACTSGSLRCDPSMPIRLTCAPTVAQRVGDTVWCQATVSYRVISPLSEGPLGLGLQNLYSAPITVRVEASASVGVRG
jgi:Flp pilus assembly protein TadG